MLGWGAVLVVVLWGLSLRYKLSFIIPWAERKDGSDWVALGVSAERGALNLGCGHASYSQLGVSVEKVAKSPPWAPRPAVSWAVIARRNSVDAWGDTTPFLLSVPLLYPAAVLVPGAVWAFMVHRRRTRPGLCRGCGYEVNAAEAPCPECGLVA